MTDVLKAKEYGVVARANLFQRTVDVGDALVDADLYDLAGGVHHLSDYRGKYVLLDFWVSASTMKILGYRRLGRKKSLG